MDSYENFSASVLKKVAQFPPNFIKLFHLHFTIEEECELIQVDLCQELKIHQIFLPPNYIQRQTVYKHADLRKILDMANKLFNCPQITLIGTKLECLVKTCDLIEQRADLREYNVNYIEVHLGGKNFASCANFPQLLSFSQKNNYVATAIRLEPHQTHVIPEIFSFYNEQVPLLVEVSVYDHWFKNVETDWKKYHQILGVEQVFAELIKAKPFFVVADVCRK